MNEARPAPDAPPTSPSSGDDVQQAALLLAFVRERDVPCPRCGYNLRNLTRPVCPECDEPLLLRVGIVKLRIVRYVATLIPSMFCAVAMGMFAVMVLVRGLPGSPPWEALATMAFMVTSGACGLVLLANARRFLKLSDSAQAVAAIITWTLHIMVFLAVAARA